MIVDATVVVQSVLNAAQVIGQFDAAQIAGLHGIGNWRGWQRVRILSADTEFCRVLLPEYGREETVASVKVIPRLPRALIDHAIAACGTRYDLPREIKQAALALETNAARTRAERTQALVEELAETTFPIPVSGTNVTVSPRPLTLSPRGNGATAMRGAANTWQAPRAAAGARRPGHARREHRARRRAAENEGHRRPGGAPPPRRSPPVPPDRA